jgi:hypothetical protein
MKGCQADRDRGGSAGGFGSARQRPRGAVGRDAMIKGSHETSAGAADEHRHSPWPRPLRMQALPHAPAGNRTWNLRIKSRPIEV